VLGAVVANAPPDIGDIRLLVVPYAEWRVLLFLIGAAGVATLAFGLAPALQATRLEPIRTIRGEMVTDARPHRARHFLIGLQVSASALLLIVAAVFLRSAFHSAAFDSGMRTADTLLVQIAEESTRQQIVQAVATEPSVAAVAASWPELTPRAARAEASRMTAKVGYRLIAPEYFSVLDIPLLRGRAFTPNERSTSLAVAIVSETAARTLWPNSDALGQAVRLSAVPTDDPRPQASLPGEPRLEAQSFTVIGVARDVAGLRIAPFDKAVVYLPADVTTPAASLIVRVHGDPEAARQTLLNRLTAIDPSMGRQVVTMRTLSSIDTFFLQLMFWLTMALGALALALTLSGLFSVLSYLVEQRTREIGVRMALGATARDVTRLVLSQSLAPVGGGLLIGAGAAAAFAGVLLATPVAAGISALVHVTDPVAYAASLLIIVIACAIAAAIPASRAARLDPAQTLRQE
jgi:hypothetical protein